MRLGTFIFTFFLSINCYCNDSLLIPKLFQNLLNKQVTETNFFVEGCYPSFRQRANETELKADNNIFYTALVAYTLQELKPYLTIEETIVADTIINRASKAFSFYKNTKGRLSYNFWPTINGGSFFPNDALLSRMKNKLALPDDLDDTGIILSVLNIGQDSAKKAHSLMQQFANGKYNTIKNTFKKYKKTPAYSTWYGVKMPVDFDFGVHCNILSFVNKYNLTWNSTDSATFQLLLNMIDNKFQLTHSKYISPYYAYSPILIYHIARLMNTKKMDDLEARKNSIGNEILHLLNTTDNDLYKILLTTSLYKLNIKAPKIELNESVVDGSLNNTDFVYYTGHLFGHLNNTIKKVASSLNTTQFKWYCSAFNDCILIEYLILKHRKKASF